MKALASARESIRAALRGAQSDLDALRTKITELAAERQRIESEPRDRAQVSQLVDTMIADAAMRSPFDLGALWSVSSRPFEAIHNFNASALGWNSPGNGFVPGNLFATFAVWDPARLKSLIMANAPEGITDAARERALKKIDAELLSAEISEEVLCRELENATGVLTLRREDARLDLVVAPASELEAA